MYCTRVHTVCRHIDCRYITSTRPTPQEIDYHSPLPFAIRHRLALVLTLTLVLTLAIGIAIAIAIAMTGRKSAEVCAERRKGWGMGDGGWV